MISGTDNDVMISGTDNDVMVSGTNDDVMVSGTIEAVRKYVDITCRPLSDSATLQTKW